MSSDEQPTSYPLINIVEVHARGLSSDLFQDLVIRLHVNGIPPNL
jgi:hypothetical protein